MYSNKLALFSFLAVMAFSTSQLRAQADDYQAHVAVASAATIAGMITQPDQFEYWCRGIVERVAALSSHFFENPLPYFVAASAVPGAIFCYKRLWQRQTSLQNEPLPMKAQLIHPQPVSDMDFDIEFQALAAEFQMLRQFHRDGGGIEEARLKLIDRARPRSHEIILEDVVQILWNKDGLTEAETHRIAIMINDIFGEELFQDEMQNPLPSAPKNFYEIDAPLPGAPPLYSDLLE